MKRHSFISAVAPWFIPALLTAQPAIEVYSVDPLALTKVKASLQSSKSPFTPALKKLLRDAEKAMDVDPVSVVDKDAVPPSGDKHDYMSLSRYWWPDPTKPDGLPYIRRDGETNPEIGKYPDHEQLVVMTQAVSTLGLAYFFSGKAEYAQHAGRFIRTWFLDSATAMNPNLNYSQAVPGRSEGRGPGVLDGRHTALVIDAVGMIRGSEGWTDADDAALRAWFGRYVEWLTTSKNGVDESEATNNHGTWYDAHLLPAAMYAGNADLARRVVKEAPEKRILAQIEPDGTQPKELARTRSFHYSVFNLEAHVRLATQARRFGVDLWSASSVEGQRIRTALEYLLPYARGEAQWPHKDIDELSKASVALLLLRMHALTNDPKYLESAIALGDTRLATHRDLLLTGVSPSRAGTTHRN